jgi:hypothetical protein
MLVIRIRRFMLGGIALVALATLALGGCSDDDNAPLSPQLDPVVTNHIDNFEFQMNTAEKVTQTLTYPWRNTGAQAVIDHSSNLTEGTVAVSLRDSTGALLYSQSLTEHGTFDSATGLAGAWAIRVDMRGVSGRFNFRVQKKG